MSSPSIGGGARFQNKGQKPKYTMSSRSPNRVGENPNNSRRQSSNYQPNSSYENKETFGNERMDNSKSSSRR